MKKDVIIIGAGLSGIGAACHLARKNPEKSYVILESRDTYGGTWDLFRYPGIRSDSNMYTFGYSFKPWEKAKSFASAEDILSYLHEAMEEHNVEPNIIYHQFVSAADFSTETGKWTVHARNTETGEETSYESQLLFSCCGYYSYEEGYTPEFEGVDAFKGDLVHPQDWPEDLDYADKKVVVIGSGATAITLIPNMADQTASITMLQRSPTYVGALPNEDKVAEFIKSVLPLKPAFDAIRLKNVIMDVLIYNACQRFPEAMKKFLINNMKKELGDFPLDPHFIPNYDPWDQRLCLAPDGDFFKALREGKADVVTDHIDRFTENGILLQSGRELEADVIITATGLNLLAFGGIAMSVDGEAIDLPEKYTYKGLMLNDVPNAVFFIGYTNASWTLKSDLTSEYAHRLMEYLDKHDYNYFVAHIDHEDAGDVPVMDLESGYVQRSAHLMPKQGNRVPWKLYQNYFLDFFTMRIRSVEDDALEFKKAKHSDKEGLASEKVRAQA